MQSGTKQAEVEENMRQAEAAGVTSIPTVFINGIELEVDVLFSLETYIEIIEELLAR